MKGDAGGVIRTWLITGCGSGFGRLLAERALARGDRVVATARRVAALAPLAQAHPGTALCAAMDVTDPASVRAALAAAVERFGRIDVLVNNAGFGMQAAVEEASDAQVRAMFEVNMFGALDVIRAALPQLRAQGAGHIVNISSVGGRTSAPLIGLYSASKFAIEGLSMGLAMELAPFGIKVTAVEPGAFATGFAGAVQGPDRREPAYRALHEQLDAVLADLHFADAAGCVEAILRAVDDPDPPRQLIAGGMAYAAVEAVMAQQAREMAAWRAVSEAADRD